MTTWRQRIVVGCGLSALLGAVGYRRHALDASGAGGAVVVGTSLYTAGGWRWSAWLLTFFVSSSVLSRVGRRRKAVVVAEFSKGDRRDLGQALANGGVAALCAWGHLRNPNMPFWTAAAACALAEANADTWATELGTLSRSDPRLVTTLRTVPAGTSGGVSATGLGAAVAGASLVALTVAFTQEAGQRRRWLCSVTLAGLVGSLCDSVLGATVQAMYRCPQCQSLTERRVHRCGTTTTCVRGYRWMNNDAVNALSTAAAAVIGGALIHGSVSTEFPPH